MRGRFLGGADDGGDFDAPATSQPEHTVPSATRARVLGACMPASVADGHCTTYMHDAVAKRRCAVYV